MADSTIYYSIALILLLLLSGLFSSSETALTAVSKGYMTLLAQQGNKKAQRVLFLMKEQQKLIASILFCNNFVNILASALMTSLLVQLYGATGVIYATIIVTLMVVIFAEVLPKSLALLKADSLALHLSLFLYIIYIMLQPVTVLIHAFNSFIFSLFKLDKPSSHEHDDELRGYIEMHKGEGEDIKHERQMLRSILDLDEYPIDNVMTHRQSVFMINIDSDIQKNIHHILKCPYTRVPVYQDDKDNVIGVIHAKELLRHLDKVRKDSSYLKKVMTKPWFVLETTSMLSQLQAFKKRREHFSLVVDEYGSLLGVVTLEDILEDIVGVIDDEHDPHVEGVSKNDDGSLIVQGDVSVRLLNREFEWQLPDYEASTIAGLVLMEARIIPSPGQEFSFFGFRFRVLERKRNQITKLQIYPALSTRVDAP